MAVQRIRLRGVVRLAEAVRRELAQPIGPAQKAQLRDLVADSLRRIDEILRKEAATVDALPGPTRQAYQYLANLDLGSVAAPATEECSQAVCRSVSFRGLSSCWGGILDALARPLGPECVAGVHASICHASEALERSTQEGGVSVRQLTPQTRRIRGWLAFFAQRENFDDYVAGVNRARPVFDTALGSADRFGRPALVHFRPTRALYQARRFANATRINLPTPMIVFREDLFRTLAETMFANGRRRQQVLQATAGDEYQSLQAELDALGGIEGQTRGACRDLRVSFERVNETYFGGSLARPKLAWSRVFTGRKLGHYDPVGDTVIVSCTLDRRDIPEFALDFVMFHELLHKRLGISWRNGRAHAHTAQFREAERRFQEIAEAEDVLQRLAASP